MSLQSQFGPDLNNIFLAEEEFAEKMTFRIVEDGIQKEFETIVVWDTETLKNRAVVQQQGIYLGSVLCFIAIECFKVEPKPEQILYRKRQVGAMLFWEGWRIVDITNAEECYELYLDRLVA